MAQAHSTEGTTEHDSPARPGRSRGVGKMILDRLSVEAEITETEQIAAGMTRVRLSGDGLRKLTCTPGQQLRVFTGDPDASSMRGRLGDLRTYSVWHFDADAGVLDLCVMAHQNAGPGARWALAARPGQLVRFRGPEGSFTLRPDAAYHLFVGEETASVALGAMLAAVPAGTPVYGAIETATEEARLPLPRAGELSFVLRGDASAAASALLVDAVRALDLPAEPGIAYVAGEARTIQLVREHLVRERGWPRRSVLTKPFWTPGKTGME
ncbi:siderophore-interacting protein [Yinghuangia soli]|uniref:Siderophore-interacting protein n=1 Tax=Yinghuangia soli TaxID=2908204 RepID=A0AA41Q5J3_9ACTN|nr:siderophore-interacting protein [Yinghuangia soli]MCF2531964.1 siderophore-interacting protein [Yinghuangia soli]